MTANPKPTLRRRVGARAAAILMAVTLVGGVSTVAASPATAAVSGEQAVAQRLAQQYTEGKLRFLKPEVFERQIRPLAETGTARAGCEVDVRILQILAMSVDKFAPVTISDMGRPCMGSTLNCNISLHCLTPAAAIDFAGARDQVMQLNGFNTSGLLAYLDTIVPPESRAGQSNCQVRPAYQNLTPLTDGCDHQHFDLFKATGNVKYDQASIPVVATLSQQGNISAPAIGSHVFYPAPDNQLANAFYTDGKWNFGTVGASVRPGSAVASDAAGDNILFAAPSNSLYNAFYADGRWQASQIGGAVSPTGNITVAADGKQAFFTGTDNKLWSAYYADGQWKTGSLGGSVRAGSPIVTTDDGKRAFYIGADARLMNAFYADGAWKIGTVGNIGVSADSGLATPDAGGTVYYTNSTGSLVNAYYSEGTWKTGVIGGSVRANSPLSTTADGKTVVYIGTDNKIRNAYYASGAWRIGNLGGEPSTVSGLEIADDGQHIFYANSKQQLANLFYTGSAWENGDLGGSIRTN